MDFVWDKRFGMFIPCLLLLRFLSWTVETSDSIGKSAVFPNPFTDRFILPCLLADASASFLLDILVDTFDLH